MDAREALNVVTERIMQLEPPKFSRIIAWFLVTKYGDKELIRIAFFSDKHFEAVVQAAKHEIDRIPPDALPVSTPISPSLTPKPVIDISVAAQVNPFSARPFSSPIAIKRPIPNLDIHGLHEQQLNGPTFSPLSYHDAVAELQNRTQSMSLIDYFEPTGLHDYYPEEAIRGFNERRSRRSPSLPDFPIKQCHYFSRGFCKHGSSYRYFHGDCSPEDLVSICDTNMNHIVNDEHMYLSGSLERLEIEIAELLKLRGGAPIPVAALPIIYFETYGRILQADGYLAESQRNGKVGYGLTKLLSRLRNSICIIDRPYGQHSIILAEDAAKYPEYKMGRNSVGTIVSGSRQIYLTFPAESTFSEEDVAEYFSTFGKVEDVRMPCQQERMFGFVTFSSPETVKTILSKGNPHFVRGSRVLVKPYREKMKLPERRYAEPAIYYPYHFGEMESEFLSTPRGFEPSKMLRKKQLMEEYVQARERQHSIELQLARHADFQPASHFNYLPDTMNFYATADETTNHVGSNYTGFESAQRPGLPDSPFSSPMASRISAAT